MIKKIGGVILAAGQGTRLKMDIPKPLAPIMGQTLVDYPITALSNFYAGQSAAGLISLVVGHRKEEVIDHVKNFHGNLIKKIHFPYQERQLGTADALKCYFDQVEDAKETDYTIVLCADTPLIRSNELEELLHVLENGKLDGVVATFFESNPTGYGRIVRSSKGLHIVEEKDATDDIRKITEVNSGVYILKTEFILQHLGQIDSNNNSNEFYLTDLFQDDFLVEAVSFADKELFLGVNNLFQLNTAEKYLRKRKIAQQVEKGVYFLDPDSVSIDERSELSLGCKVYSSVLVEGNSKIGVGSTLEQGVVVKNSTILENTTVKAYSYIDDSTVSKGASIGPFAHLRPGSKIGEGCKVGNFVETKKSILKPGSKVSHLSYVGDAEIGENTNIGCGFITCNYDGANKHKTVIGKNSFIGSDSQMIAPITIGDGCYVASGSTITNDLKDGDFAVARSRQETKPNLARRFIKTKSKE